MPRVASTANIASPVNGMLIYDLSSNCAKAYDNGAWSACLSQQPTPAVSFNCAASAINGSYSQNTALTTANTVTIIVVNNSFSPVTITPATSDIILSGTGATGMSVASASGPATPGSGGGTATITYTLSGTPSAAGAFTANWAKLTLACAKTATVCEAISAVTVTSTTSPSTFAALIAAGDKINFTAAGGTPNTAVSWAMTSSPAGLFSNSASGTGTTVSAILTAGAVGSVTTTFSAANSCGSIVTGSQTVSFGAPPAFSTTLCAQDNTRLNATSLPANATPVAVTIGGVNMTVTRTITAAN